MPFSTDYTAVSERLR